MCAVCVFVHAYMCVHDFVLCVCVCVCVHTYVYKYVHACEWTCLFELILTIGILGTHTVLLLHTIGCRLRKAVELLKKCKKELQKALQFHGLVSVGDTQ